MSVFDKFRADFKQASGQDSPYKEWNTMASYQVIDHYPPFEYGSTVRWISPKGVAVEGSVCGFTLVGTTEEAIAREVEPGAVLVLVEDYAGKTVEVPLKELELI